MTWYNVGVCRAHRGAGRLEFVTAYIFADDPVEVLRRYRHMPGVKRDINGRTPVPDVIPLSPDESSALENRIRNEKRISVNIAKIKWYYVSVD